MDQICACHRGALPPPGERWAGRIHSVYRRAINIALESGQLVTVSPMADGRGPYSFHVAGAALPPGHVPGERVVVTETLLRIGARQAEIPGDGIYDLPRGTLRLTPRRCTEAAALLERLLEREASRVDADPVWAVTQKRIRHRCDMLVQRFCRGDIPAIVENGRALLGLGQGLTPSGDDILTGMFAVLGMQGSPFPAADLLLSRVIRGQREQTTDVSWQMLSAAAAGCYKQMLIDCAQALGTEGVDATPSAERVLGIGHSSGRDMLLGCLTALRILQQQYDTVQEV